MSEAKWYVVHTYSGYENKVKANIDKTIENRHLKIRFWKSEFLSRKSQNSATELKRQCRERCFRDM